MRARQRVVLDGTPVIELDPAEVAADRAAVPVDPAHPVIASRADLADALTARFLENTDTGADDGNDALVDALVRWKRSQKVRPHG